MADTNPRPRGRACCTAIGSLLWQYLLQLHLLWRTLTLALEGGHLLHGHRVATAATILRLHVLRRTCTSNVRTTATPTVADTCCTAIGSRPGVAESASTRKPPERSLSILTACTRRVAAALTEGCRVTASLA